eukprot:gene7064-9642_t
MEGYLFKKGRGESSFGRKSWKERWFILEGSVLSYYDTLDLTTGKAINQKGSADILGCEVSDVLNEEKQEKPNIVLLKNNRSGDRNPLVLQSNDQNIMKVWVKALKAAAGGESKSNVVDYEKCYIILGLNPRDNPPLAEINRSYRKAALKSHPDKGGDLHEFKALQEAFAALTSKFEDDENEKLYDIVKFVATIEKGPQGVGLGMVVVEDVKKQAITIKQVLPAMNLKSLTPGAEGKILPGDRLLLVGQEDVAHLPLLRVVQKINDFRVPVGSTVRLTFSRKVLKNVPVQNNNLNDMPKSNLSNAYSEEVEEKKVSSRPVSSNGINKGVSSDGSDYGSVVPNSNSQDYSNNNNNDNNNKSYDLDPVKYYAAISEIEELKIELNLKEIQSKEESLLMKKENVQLKIQIQKLKDLLSESVRKHRLYELQIQQLSAFSTVSNEQLIQTENDIAVVVMAMQSQEKIEISSDLESYLSNHGLNEDETMDNIQQSQRSAITIANTIDRSGVILRKWDLMGDSAIEKLMRFEDVLTSDNESFANNNNNDNIFLPSNESIVSILESIKRSSSLSTVPITHAEKKMNNDNNDYDDFKFYNNLNNSNSNDNVSVTSYKIMPSNNISHPNSISNTNNIMISPKPKQFSNNNNNNNNSIPKVSTIKKKPSNNNLLSSTSSNNIIGSTSSDNNSNNNNNNNNNIATLYNIEKRGLGITSNTSKVSGASYLKPTAATLRKKSSNQIQ